MKGKKVARGRVALRRLWFSARSFHYNIITSARAQLEFHCLIVEENNEMEQNKFSSKIQLLLRFSAWDFFRLVSHFDKLIFVMIQLS